MDWVFSFFLLFSVLFGVVVWGGGDDQAGDYLRYTNELSKATVLEHKTQIGEK